MQRVFENSEFSECDLLGKVVCNILNPDALLFHGVAVAHGHAAVLLGFEIDRDAVGLSLIHIFPAL